MKKLMALLKVKFWRVRDTFSELGEPTEINITDDPFWYINRKTWSQIFINVREKGAPFYKSYLQQWVSNLNFEYSMMDESEVEFKDSWMALDIMDAYKIMAVIEMISVGISIPALEYLNDLDTNVRDMAVGILLNTKA